MRRIQRCILTLFLGIMLSLATVAFVSSWAGPVENQLLRDAAGCDAAVGFDIERVKTARKFGADPNAASTPSNTVRSMTPLICVICPLYGSNHNNDLNHKAFEIAMLLFAAGAKLGLDEQEVLSVAIFSGNLELVRLLIDKGASPTAKLNNFTPSELARKYDQLDIYKYLISRGGTPVDSKSAAQMVFIEAARWGEIAAMERAIKEGARINGVDTDGETALIAAVSKPIVAPSWAAAIWWLLDHGADPNQAGDSGLPLHIFVRRNKATLAGETGRPDVIKPMAEETLARLLKAGAKVSGIDAQSRTPLHVAAEADNVLAAEFLIALGAKVMARDEAGKTPLDYAESGPMIKLLKASGATER
jgi:ankyrin repeat protein